MTLQKNNSTPSTPTPSPEGETILQALRSNMTLLRELAARYEVETQPDCPEDRPMINSPYDVKNLLGYEMSILAQEQIRVILLDTRNNVIGQRVIYQGNVNSSMVRPAEVLRPAVTENAPKIVMVHNHPTGDPTPSPEDMSITRNIVDAGNLLGIELVDHVVIAGKKFLSMSEQGMLKTS